MRLFVIGLVFALVACGGGGEEDPLAAFIPQLDAAEKLLPQALVCPGSPATEQVYDPILVGSLEELGAEVPVEVVAGATMQLVKAGEITRVAIWSGSDARPVAMMFMAELEDSSYGLRRVRYCS